MTDLITWEPRMSVGVAILDEDHRRIMKMINRLHAAMLEKQGRDVLAEIFHEMTMYIALHFESEESLFAQTGYEGAMDQKNQHEAMKKKTETIKKQFQNSPDTVEPMEVLYFLKDWWLGHIMNSDMKYAEFLKEKGVR